MTGLAPVTVFPLGGRLYILSQIYNRKCVKNELSKIYIYVQRLFFNISSLQSVSASLLSSAGSSDKSTSSASSSAGSSDKSTSSASSSAGTRDGDSPVSTGT